MLLGLCTYFKIVWFLPYTRAAKIVIIIPSRLNAKRLQNKPLKLINDKEMILHVHDVALKANIGDVFVATPDIEILNIVRKNKGKADFPID